MKDSELGPLPDPELLYRGPESTARRLHSDLERSGVRARLIDTGNPISIFASLGTHAVEIYVSRADLGAARSIADAVLRDSLIEEAPRVEELRRGCLRDLALGLLAAVGAGAALYAAGARDRLLLTAVVILVAVIVGVLLSSRR